jgi:hypothetical protein
MIVSKTYVVPIVYCVHLKKKPEKRTKVNTLRYYAANTSKPKHNPYETIWIGVPQYILFRYPLGDGDIERNRTGGPKDSSLFRLSLHYSNQEFSRESRPKPPSLSPAMPAESSGGEVLAAIVVGVGICLVQ